MGVLKTLSILIVFILIVFTIYILANSENRTEAISSTVLAFLLMIPLITLFYS